MAAAAVAVGKPVSTLRFITRQNKDRKGKKSDGEKYQLEMLRENKHCRLPQLRLRASPAEK